MSEERKQNLNKLKSFAMSCTALVSALAASSCTVSRIEPLGNGGWKVTNCGATLPQITNGTTQIMNGVANMKAADNGGWFFGGNGGFIGGNGACVPSGGYHAGYGDDPAVITTPDGRWMNVTQHNGCHTKE